MNDQNFSLKGVIQKAKEYVRNWKKLSKLVFIEQIVTTLSGLILDLLIALLGFITFFFLSIAFALYLAETTGSYALGFLITSGIYLIIIIIIALMKTRIENVLINVSIRKFLKKWNEPDEE